METKTTRLVHIVGKQVLKDCRSAADSDKLRDAFENAIQNMKKGKLKRELSANFDTYLQQLQKYIHKKSRKLSKDKKASSLRAGRKMPSLVSAAGLELEELSAPDKREELPAMEGVRHSPSRKLPFNVYKGQAYPLKISYLKKLSKKDRKRLCHLYCRQALLSPVAGTDVDLSEILAVLESDTDTQETLKVRWLPKMNLLMKASLGCRGSALVSIMQMLYNEVQMDVEGCLEKSKVNRAGRLAAILKTFLTMVHTKMFMMADSKDLKGSIRKPYRQLMSAYLSLYIDLTLLSSKKEEKKKLMGRKLCSFVSCLLQAWPISLLEVLLQISCVSLENAPVIMPLARKALSYKPAGRSEYYLKYILVVKTLADKLPDVMEENKDVAKCVPASPDFLTWMTDTFTSAVIDELPTNDRKFQGLKITKFFLEEADQDLVAAMVDGLCAEQCSTDDTKSTVTRPGQSDHEDPSHSVVGGGEGLFFLDKGGPASHREENQLDDISLNEEDTAVAASVVARTMEDIDNLFSDQEHPDIPIRPFRIDRCLVSNDESDFFDSDIVEISHVSTYKQGDGTGDAESKGQSEDRKRKKKKKLVLLKGMERERQKVLKDEESPGQSEDRKHKKRPSQQARKKKLKRLERERQKVLEDQEFTGQSKVDVVDGTRKNDKKVKRDKVRTTTDVECDGLQNGTAVEKEDVTVVSDSDESLLGLSDRDMENNGTNVSHSKTVQPKTPPVDSDLNQQTPHGQIEWGENANTDNHDSSSSQTSEKQQKLVGSASKSPKSSNVLSMQMEDKVLEGKGTEDGSEESEGLEEESGGEVVITGVDEVVTAAVDEGKAERPEPCDPDMSGSESDSDSSVLTIESSILGESCASIGKNVSQSQKSDVLVLSDPETSLMGSAVEDVTLTINTETAASDSSSDLTTDEEASILYQTPFLLSGCSKDKSPRTEDSRDAGTSSSIGNVDSKKEMEGSSTFYGTKPVCKRTATPRPKQRSSSEMMLRKSFSFSDNKEIDHHKSRRSLPVTKFFHSETERKISAESDTKQSSTRGGAIASESDTSASESKSPTSDRQTPTGGRKTPKSESKLSLSKSRTPKSDKITSEYTGKTSPFDLRTKAGNKTPTSDNKTTTGSETPTSDNKTAKLGSQTPKSDNKIAFQSKTPTSDQKTPLESKTPTTECKTATSERKTPTSARKTSLRSKTPTSDRKTATSESRTSQSTGVSLGNDMSVFSPESSPKKGKLAATPKSDSETKTWSSESQCPGDGSPIETHAAGRNTVESSESEVSSEPDSPAVLRVRKRSGSVNQNILSASSPDTPTKTPTKNATPTKTPTKNATLTKTPIKNVTPTKTPTKNATPSKTSTKKATPTKTPTKNATPTKTPTKNATPTKTPTKNVTPTKTPTKTATKLTPKSDHKTLTSERKTPRSKRKSSMAESTTTLLEQEIVPESSSLQADMLNERSGCKAPQFENKTPDKSLRSGSKTPKSDKKGETKIKSSVTSGSDDDVSLPDIASFVKAARAESEVTVSPSSRGEKKLSLKSESDEDFTASAMSPRLAVNKMPNITRGGSGVAKDKAAKETVAMPTLEKEGVGKTEAPRRSSRRTQPKNADSETDSVCSDVGPSSARGKRAVLSARKTKPTGAEVETQPPTKTRRTLSDVEEGKPPATPGRGAQGKTSIRRSMGPVLKERDPGRKSEAKKAGDKRPADSIYDFVSSTDEERTKSPKKEKTAEDPKNKTAEDLKTRRKSRVSAVGEKAPATPKTRYSLRRK